MTSADIARRVSIGSRAVFVCEHVYMSVGKNCPTATGLKSGCVGFRGMASGLAKAHITATEEAAKQGKTMTGTVRHEPGWRGFFIRAAAEETALPVDQGTNDEVRLMGSVGCIFFVALAN